MIELDDPSTLGLGEYCLCMPDKRQESIAYWRLGRVSWCSIVDTVLLDFLEFSRGLVTLAGMCGSLHSSCSLASLSSRPENLLEKRIIPRLHLFLLMANGVPAAIASFELMHAPRDSADMLRFQ